MMLLAAYAADILMIAASLGAACYCLILSRRLSRLTSFDKGIGGAIAVLSAQVDEMKSALAEAKAGSDGAGHHLQDLVRQARDISGELELMIAACHDFAEEALHVQGGEGTAEARTQAATAEDVGAEAPGLAAEPVSEAREMDVPDPDQSLPVFGTRRSPPPEPVFRRHPAEA